MALSNILSGHNFYLSFLLFTLLPPESYQDGTHLMGCLKGWMAYSNACYQFNQYPISPRVDAKNRCFSNASSLLTIENDEERQWITSQIVKYNTAQTWWIGLKGLDESYHWMQKAISTSYSPPFANEPDNANGKEDCAMISNRGLLRDEVCSREQRFICKAKRANVDGPCVIKGFAGIPIKTSNYCYWYVFLSKKNWDDAKQFCRSIKLQNSPEKADLLSLSDYSERTEVRNTLNLLRAFGPAWWTGLRYQDGAKKYTYSDGTTYSPTVTPWLTKEAITDKEDKCGAILSNGFVTALPCNVNIGYICKHSRVIPQNRACPDYWISAKDTCYFINQSSPLSWAAANYTCGMKGGHLLKTDSLDEKNWLELTGALQFYRFWTGLHIREGSEPGVFEWSDNTGLNESLVTWDNGDLARTHCTRLDISTGKFIYAQCERNYPNLACEYKTKQGRSSCLQGWRYNMQKCYYFSNASSSTWHNSPQECHNAYSNQDRTGNEDYVNYITIENSKALEFVQATAKSLNMDNIWLGLNNVDDGKNWAWKDAPTVPSNTVSRSPSSGQPNMKYNCVSISYGGLYKTTDCNVKIPYICETKSKPNVASPFLTAKSTSLGGFVVATLTGMLLRL